MTSTYSSAPPMLYQLLTWKSWPAQPPLLSVLLLLCLTKVNKGELSITLTVPQLRLMDPWWSNPSLPGSPRRSFNLKGMLLFRQAQWAITYFDPRIGSEGKLTPEAGKPQDRSTKVLTVRSQWGIDRCKKVYCSRWKSQYVKKCLSRRWLKRQPMRCPVSGAKDIKSGGGRWVGGSMFFFIGQCF